MILSRREALVLIGTLAATACNRANASGEVRAAYRWRRLTAEAPYPKSYNYPVHVAKNGRFFALHPKGTWSSLDGTEWQEEALPFSGTNSAYLSTLHHENASFALGRIEGNYQGFEIDPTVRRTSDYRVWEPHHSPSLPKLIFYGTASFDGYIWIVGGYDGSRTVNGVWRSRDGLDWQSMPEPPWTPRARVTAVAFGSRLLIIGGGTFEQHVEQPVRQSEVWATSDGVRWEKLADHVGRPDPFGFTALDFDKHLWLAGANRAGGFRSEMISTADGRVWQPESAPWSPRGGVAVWKFADQLFITGGKYSQVVNGETQFEYANDVWTMTRV